MGFRHTKGDEARRTTPKGCSLVITGTPPRRHPEGRQAEGSRAEWQCPNHTRDPLPLRCAQRRTTSGAKDAHEYVTGASTERGCGVPQESMCQANDQRRTTNDGFQKNQAAPWGRSGLCWRSPPGRRGKHYIDGGVVEPVVAPGCAGVALSPCVFVISLTSTRRFFARPSEVLFESTGLSLPSPTR